MNVLTIETLTHCFSGPGGTVTALQDVGLTVNTGELVVVLGPSGCGKTTLLLAAGTLLRPTQGRVCIQGTDPYALSPNTRARFRARTIGFVFQQFHLIPYLTVFENVLAPSLASRVPDAKAKATALIEKFGLTDRLRHVPGALSMGERQRVALARALLHDPPLLLADEPTGNLDAVHSRLILHHLADLAREGRAVLLVTHDDAARSLATRVVRLEKGRAVP